MGLISNGTTIFDAGALDSGVAKGATTFIKKLTASSSGTLSFVDGASSVVLDNTYKEYIFFLNNIQPATNAAKFRMIGSADTGSNYGVATTTTMFEAMQDEGGSNETVRYEDGDDAAQSTSAINISTGVGADADECVSGDLHLFDPASTAFVKHFISTTQFVNNSGTPYCKIARVGGYVNTTSAVDAIQFSFSSGNIDSGVIKMYGIK